LLAEFDDTAADLAMLVSPAEHGGESAGRVLLDKTGRPAAIAEVSDIRLRGLPRGCASNSVRFAARSPARSCRD
jgi:hypothetical protein